MRKTWDLIRPTVVLVLVCAVISGLLAVPLFGEVPTLLQLAGMALVLGAVLLYTKAELPKKE